MAGIHELVEGRPTEARKRPGCPDAQYSVITYVLSRIFHCGYIPPFSPVALDESLHSIEQNIPTNTKAFILKPQRLGSLNKFVDFVILAGSLNIKPVLSHVFESKWGLNFLSLLALACPESVVHGLAPSYLSSDQPGLAMDRDRILTKKNLSLNTV